PLGIPRQVLRAPTHSIRYTLQLGVPANGGPSEQRIAVELSSRLAEILGLQPSADAISQDGRWDTWGDVKQLGQELLGVGVSDVPPNTFVALVGRNTAATISALLALLIDERPVLLLNSMQPDSALANEIRSVRPAVVVAVAPDWQRPGIPEAAAT